MKRRLFNAGAVVSLVLCLAVAGLWARSYWRWDHLETGRLLMLSSESGALEVCLGWEETSEGWILDSEPTEPYVVGLMMFSAAKLESPGMNPAYLLILPHWVPMIFLTVLPSAWWWRRTRRRKTAFACPTCGYDLRGTPGSSCPECGAPHAGNHHSASASTRT